MFASSAHSSHPLHGSARIRKQPRASAGWRRSDLTSRGRGQSSIVQSGRAGPAPWDFEPLEGIFGSDAISNNSGTRAPRFELLRIEVARTRRVRIRPRTPAPCPEPAKRAARSLLPSRRLGTACASSRPRDPAARLLCKLSSLTFRPPSTLSARHRRFPSL